MRYVKAKIEEYRIDLTYRIYITDSLYYMADNKRLTKRFYDLINSPKDHRSGDEIALDIINKLGLKMEKDDEKRI